VFKTVTLDFTVGTVPCRLIDVAPDLAWMRDRDRVNQHRHPVFELYYVTDGSCSVTSGDSIYTITAGQMILISPAVYHRVDVSATGISGSMVTFEIMEPVSNRSDKHAVRFFEAFRQEQIVILNAQDPHVRMVMDQLSTLRTDYDGSYIRQEKLRTYCTLFLLQLFELLTLQKPEMQVQTVETVPQEYEIDEFFSHNFSSNRSNAQLARQLNVSQRQLYRILKKSYGVNYREKLSEIRIEIAKDYLYNTDKSIGQIAEILGYSSGANFSTFVKKATGKTPSQIRKERKKV